MAQQQEANYISIETPNGLFPAEGGRVVPLYLDFTIQRTYRINLASFQAQDKIEFVQGIFVDNTLNSSPLTVSNTRTGQIVTYPAYSFGWASLFCPNQPDIVFFSANTTIIVQVQLTSFPVANDIILLNAPGAAGATVIVAGNQAAAGDGTIAVGGTAQNLFGGTVPVNGFAVYNPDAANDLWVSDSGAAVINGAGSIRIQANGGGYETPYSYKPVSVVSIISAIAGAKFTARRW